MRCKGFALLTTNSQVHAAFFMMLFCVCLMSSLCQRPIISEHMWAKLILTNQHHERVLQWGGKDDMGCKAKWPVISFSSTKNIMVNLLHSTDSCTKAKSMRQGLG